MQFGLDRDGEYADDLAIDEIERVDQDQNGEHIGTIGQGGASFGG